MRLRTSARLFVIEAARALARNKVRSGLAMLGIACAVATVIWVVAIGRAGTASALEALDAVGDNMVWIEAGARNAAGVRTGTHGMTTLMPSDAQAIRDEAPLVARVTESLDGKVQIVSAYANWNTRFRGVAPDYQSIRRWPIARGAFFTADDVREARTVVVIGQTVRTALFGDVEPIGEQVRIGPAPYTVVGVLGVKGPRPDGSDQDDTIILPWTTAMRHIVGKDQRWIDDILCSAISLDRIHDAEVQVSALLRDRHHIPVDGDDDFNIRDPQELQKARLKSAETLEVLLAALALLALAIGGIGIMNVMLASVTQRTREIGIRMAIGASPAAVRLQFLGEAVLLTTVSGAIGVGGAIAAAGPLQHALGWDLAMSTSVDALAVVFAAAVGVAFGMFPAVRASRLDPIEALRVE